MAMKKTLLQQLSGYLSPEELRKVDKASRLFSKKTRDKLLLWLLFEAKFKCEPKIDDKVDAFLYKIFKNEIFY